MATRIILLRVPSAIHCYPPPPLSTLPRRVPRYYISENYFELGNPSEKNSSTRGVRVGAVINALLTADSKPVRKI